jgi:DNA-binding transcriptional MerR regulator
MSAVGFAPLSPEDVELERLREACKRLNFTLRAIKEAQACLSELNVGQARQRLNNAQWQAREAKKMLAELGRAKKTKTALSHRT